MATTVRRPCLIALAAILVLLCAAPAAAAATARVSNDPPWSNEYWADEIVDDDEAMEEAAASVAARRAEAGGYAYGCARLWLAMGCPPSPGKGVNGTLVDGRRSYDRELDRFEEELGQCSHEELDPYLRRGYEELDHQHNLQCCACCLSCGLYY